MRKLISRYIIMIMAISSLILIGLFYVINNSRKEISERKVLEGITEQVISILKSNKEKDEEARVLFQNDYLNRAESLAYIIDKTMKEISTKELKELAQKLEIEDIHIIDENGIIESSSDKNSLGIDFYKRKQLKEFIPLIESDNKDEYYIKMMGYNIGNNSQMIYIGVKPESGDKGMIQITVDPSALSNYNKATNIESAISSMPIRDYVNIFVMDLETGEIVANSRNIGKYIKVEDTTNSKDGVEILKKYVDHPGKIKVNDADKLVVAEKFESNIIVLLADVQEIHRSSTTYIFMISIIILILMMVIVCFLYKLMDSFILKDIESLVKGVNEFVGGNNEVRFHVKKRTELYKMSEGLNKWASVMESKSERLSKIVSMMGKNFATYEYYTDLHQIFYSNNLPSMFEMSPEECKQMILDKFFDESERIKTCEITQELEGEIVVTKSGRYLKIQRMISKDAFYAIIRDISEEKKEQEKLFDELNKANERASKDILTGLYNRSKVKELIDTWMKEGNTKGVMLLMDLDNFKKVNDQKGHPEGDLLLKKFANILTVQFRSSDLKARIGGDEFLVFMPNKIETSILETKMRNFLDACRKELQSYYMEQKISVSIGMAFMDETTQSYEELYHCADAAMYVAKRHGKDRFYLNEDNITCMKNECISCRENCKRKKTLFVS
ncbi:MAG: GGDEF domain-containing protein [Firmicutes bacterium]|uniref:GGDEF domain-containing protein n=1 Tax=Candidatus Scybalomonas excrementavium TaxID=2840943 RepID=A0A9D9I1J9_9FIRM|nr:GGDEF domain-containing protein [Candidatus Scybalomonas excrementavium]